MRGAEGWTSVHAVRLSANRPRSVRRRARPRRVAEALMEHGLSVRQAGLAMAHMRELALAFASGYLLWAVPVSSTNPKEPARHGRDRLSFLRPRWRR